MMKQVTSRVEGKESQACPSFETGLETKAAGVL